MKYKLAPLNIVFMLVVCAITWIIFFPDPEGWVYLLVAPLCITGLVAIGIDLIIQYSITEYRKKFLIEMAIIAIGSLAGYFLFKN